MLLCARTIDVSTGYCGREPDVKNVEATLGIAGTEKASTGIAIKHCCVEMFAFWRFGSVVPRPWKLFQNSVMLTADVSNGPIGASFALTGRREAYHPGVRGNRG
jgi:hypothetical protein